MTETMLKTTVGDDLNDTIEAIQSDRGCTKPEATRIVLEKGARVVAGEHRLAGARPQTQPTNNDNDE